MKKDNLQRQLTDYALNELNEKERKEFERELLNNPELRAELEEFQSFTRMLGEDLAKEPIEKLSGPQKAKISLAASAPLKRSWFTPKLGFSAGISLAAAALLLFVLWMPTQDRRQEMVDFRMQNLPEGVGKNERVEVFAEPQKKIVAKKGTEDSTRHSNRPQLSPFYDHQGAPQALGKGYGGAPKMRSMSPSRNNIADFQRTRTKPGGHPPDSTPLYQETEASAEADFNTETYDHIDDNPFHRVANEPLSTFSVDVDTASYANLRRFLQAGQMPPKDSVRIEEMLNYFTYDYPAPKGKHPFEVVAEVAQAPWRSQHRLVRVGIQGKVIPWENRAASNLVFLIDVSGSMDEPNKLPLLQQSMKLLIEKLNEKDKVSIVVYAGASGVVLNPTSADQATTIVEAFDRLRAGGSTNGGAGIEKAYELAKNNFIQGGNNRVILATDGDFNVGTTNQGSLIRLVEEKAKTGVFLTVLGFGMGNYKDSTLEKLADKGNGNYAYIDTLSEAKKVLVEQVGGTLMTIAKDVKLQVEFNPAQVQAFRLIGYENRILRHQDFNDDQKDAGDIGSGHTVTALYEVVPHGVDLKDVPGVDPLKYQKPASPAGLGGGELLNIKVRYKEPTASKSELLEIPVRDSNRNWEASSQDFKFQAAVATFGMILRDSKYKGDTDLDMAFKMATAGKGPDKQGYRQEFIQLIEKAKQIQK